MTTTEIEANVKSWRNSAAAAMQEPGHKRTNALGEALDNACDLIRALQRELELVQECASAASQEEDRLTPRIIPHNPRTPSSPEIFTETGATPSWLQL